MWYLDYYDYDTYNNEMESNMEGWETHPVPRGNTRGTNRGFSGVKMGTLMGRDVPFEILPPLSLGWRENHRLVAVSQSDRFAMGLCSCGKVFIDGFFSSRDYQKKCELVHWEGIQSITTGPNMAVGIRADGRLIIAGCTKRDMKVFDSWRDLVQVSVGDCCMLGLRADGTVLASGDDDIERDVSSWRDIVHVSAGDKYVLGVRRDGTVVHAFAGWNDEEFDVDVSDWTDIVQADAGPYHAVGVRRDGSVVAAACPNFYEFMEDVECLNVEGWRDVAQVYAGNGVTAALRTNGSVLVARNEKHGYYNKRPASSTRMELRDAVAISLNRHYQGSDEVLALDEQGRAVMCDAGRAYPWDNWSIG